MFTWQFVDRGFSNPWKLGINIILETSKMIICNSMQASSVAKGFKKQGFKTIDESLDDRAGPKTHKTCMIIERNDKSTTKGGIRIPLFTINCGTITTTKVGCNLLA